MPLSLCESLVNEISAGPKVEYTKEIYQQFIEILPPPLPSNFTDYYSCHTTAYFTVGNKSDVKHRKVSYQEAHDYAGLNRMKYIETSSKEDNNVDQVSI